MRPDRAVLIRLAELAEAVTPTRKANIPAPIAYAALEREINKLISENKSLRMRLTQLTNASQDVVDSCQERVGYYGYSQMVIEDKELRELSNILITHREAVDFYEAD